MKVLKEKPQERVALSLRLPPELVREIDKVTSKSELSRQKLIESILDQVIHDKKFVLKIRE
ncbi:MAG: hypothetical protein HN353_14315 [Bdellovibrionales bacterium]|jgi:hypothetical protein|nr:hypothetical protein [Bdellovibrionales bacterium]MBT3526984.1 hypothetical protein [Bdellovibrionales bacterium]